MLDWYISIISPIHKKGSKMDPDNYRGISLISCIYKFLTAIINKRMENYCKEKNILSANQLGFVAGNRTSDAHLIIHNLIRKYVYKEGKHLHACFIDFSKAFDKIPRDILFQKLLDIGIKGKVFNFLKNIYSHEECKVKIGESLSSPFKTNLGVRQGCILSPILFNIFISDLPQLLGSHKHNPPKLSTSRSLSSILWADDLVLFSETESGLHCMMEDLLNYTKEKGLYINEDKSKCMIFNKTGRLMRRNLKVGGMTFPTVREYKYLGFIITPSGGVTRGIGDLKTRALFAAAQLRRKLGNNFRKHFDISIFLFKALVMPIILYLSDFWGCLKIQEKASPDLVQSKFLKQLLGVQSQTQNIGVLLETGEIPLSIFAKRNCIRNWGRIALNKKCNELVALAYGNMAQNNYLWVHCAEQSMREIGLGHLLLGNDLSPGDSFFLRAKDIFHQNAFTVINGEGKLRTYKLFKTQIGRESYLTNITNIEDRIAYTKFRLSNHKLMIEKGRYEKKHSSLRFCPFCPNKVEDEIHFLIECKNFSPPRSILLETLNIPNFTNRDRLNKISYLMSNRNIAPTIGKYLNKTFQLREFLLSKPKCNI